MLFLGNEIYNLAKSVKFGGILVFFLFGDFLNIIFSYFTMYEYYTNGQYFEGETRIASIVKLAFSIIIFTLGYFAYSKYTTKDWKKSAEGKRYALLMIMELIAVVVDFLSLKVNLLDRLELYFTALSFVLISNFIQLFPTRSRGIVSAMLLTLFLAYSCVAMTLRPEWNRIYPIELSWEF